MAISIGSSGGDDAINSSINTTPLVDVMLVLLIIFLITIPVVTQSIALNLPKEQNIARVTKPENVEISVDADGAIFWNTVPLSGTPELVERLKKVSVQNPQPEVHIRGDAKAHYESVGRVIFACQRAAIVKISFVTEPPPRG